MALEFRRPSAQVQLRRCSGDVSHRRSVNSAGVSLGDDLLRSATELTNVQAEIENARQFSISVLWTLYAATMLALGLLRRSRLLRWGGLLLLLTAIGKVVVIDSTYYAASWHFPVFNQTFIAYALLVAVLAFGGRLYGREACANESERRVMHPALLFAANLLSLA